MLDAAGCVGLATLAVLTYCIGLDRNGLGNPFYAAAVQAGVHSAHDAFFAAIDFSGTMSVDKPPLSLWLMELSVRILGLNPVGELLPDALAGVATTAVVVLMVREWTSLRWGLAAGLLSLASPMAAVMFRFNNPDALLTLLIAATVWCFSSALRRPSTWKLGAAGVLVGAAVLTKLLAGVVVLPVLLGAYALWASTSRAKRAAQIVLVGLTAVVSSIWYFIAVALTPAAQRPWIDGTSDNSPFSLLFSNNVGRLVGNGGSAATSPPGLLRMFNHEELPNFGPLVVMSVLTTVAVVILVGTANRDRLRDLLRTRPVGPAAIAILLNTSALWICLVMSYLQGGYHSYYAVISTPVLAAGITLDVAVIWRHRSTAARTWLLPVLLGTASFDAWVWSRDSSGAAFAVSMVISSVVGLLALTWLRRTRLGLIPLLVVALLLPGIYTWDSWHDDHAGGSPLGGPQGAQVSWGEYPPRPNNFNFPSRVSPELRWLLQHSGPYEYAVAMQRSEEAGSVQLATGVNVLPLSGWNQVPAGMFRRFVQLIHLHEVHYFLPTGPRLGFVSWVKAHFLRFHVGDQTVFDLTRPEAMRHHHGRRRSATMTAT